MRKLVLALVLVVIMSSIGFAATKDTTVNVVVEQYAELAAPDSITVTFTEPGTNKTAAKPFVVKANYPISVSLTSDGKGTGWGTGHRHPKLTGPAGTLVEPNSLGGLGWSTWIATDNTGTTTGSTPNGLGEQYNLASGKHDLWLMLNAAWGGEQWYELTAGTYSGRVTLTVAAQ